MHMVFINRFSSCCHDLLPCMIDTTYLFFKNFCTNVWVDNSIYVIGFFIFENEMELNTSMLNLEFCVWDYASEANARCYSNLLLKYALSWEVCTLLISLYRPFDLMNDNGKRMKLEATRLTEAQRCEIIAELSKLNASSKRATLEDTKNEKYCVVML